MHITDEYLNDLFKDTAFSSAVRSSSEMQRKRLEKTLRDQVAGFWSGHTAYQIAVDGGFLKDSKRGTEKRLTKLGRTFLEQRNV